jgi:hypothetical protein
MIEILGSKTCSKKGQQIERTSPSWAYDAEE